MVWNSLGKGLRMGLVLGCQIWWNIPDGGFALTLLPTIHSGAPLRAFFFFWTKFKARHSCLTPKEQYAVFG